MQEQLKKLSTQRSASVASNRSRRIRFDERTDDRYDRGYDDRRGWYDTRDERRYDRIEIDGHHLTVMTIAQHLRTDAVMGDKTAHEVFADQDVDSPGRTKTEVTHDLRIEILGVREDLGVEVDHHNEARIKTEILRQNNFRETNMLKAKKPDGNYISLKISRASIDALVDTGASQSLMNESVARILQLNIMAIIDKAKYDLLSANQTEIKIIDQAEVEIYLKGLMFYQHVAIAKKHIRHTIL